MDDHGRILKKLQAAVFLFELTGKTGYRDYFDAHYGEAQLINEGLYAPAAAVGHSELRPLRLKALELRQLEAFLRTLSGPIVVNDARGTR